MEKFKVCDFSCYCPDLCVTSNECVLDYPCLVCLDKKFLCSGENLFIKIVVEIRYAKGLHSYKNCLKSKNYWFEIRRTVNFSTVA